MVDFSNWCNVVLFLFPVKFCEDHGFPLYLGKKKFPYSSLFWKSPNFFITGLPGTFAKIKDPSTMGEPSLKLLKCALDAKQVELHPIAPESKYTMLSLYLTNSYMTNADPISLDISLLPSRSDNGRLRSNLENDILSITYRYFRTCCRFGCHFARWFTRWRDITRWRNNRYGNATGRRSNAGCRASCHGHSCRCADGIIFWAK